MRTCARSLKGAKHCATCGVALELDRALGKCTPCHAKQVKEWRDNLTLQPTREFPGVDIDRIHRVWKNR